MPSVNERRVSAFSRSPMWCETKAWRSLARQNVFFSSAPQARTGRGNSWSTVTGSGTYPRDRLISIGRARKTRATESSVLMWMARSWVRNASAIPPSLASASASS